MTNTAMTTKINTAHTMPTMIAGWTAGSADLCSIPIQEKEKYKSGAFS